MGGKTAKSSQTITIPPEVMARYNAANVRAEQAAATPFQNYTGQFVAPLTETQRQGIAATQAASGMAQPYFQAATGYQLGAQQQAMPYYQAATGMTGQGLDVGQQYLTGATGYGLAGGQAVNPTALDAGAIQQYMSPYIQNVLQGTAGMLNQENQQAMAGQLGNAIRSGAFGGDRSGIAAANLRQQQQLANAKIYSDILNQGYGQALGTAQQQQALGLSAEQANRAAYQSTADRLAALGQQGFGQYGATAQQLAGLGQGIYGMGSQTAQGLAGLGAGAQGAALQGAQAVTAAGGLEQQTQQALDTARYNEFLQQVSYPFQVAQFLANIATGTGALSGSTTTTRQPGGFFSDRRLKENVQKIGKTYDGQHIYRYNYKGDPTPQIGLIAQEVEKQHPDAVTVDGKYRVVDYDKATDKAADRGHFYSGGLVAPQGPESMGGGVMPQNARQGYAMGGMPDVLFDPASYNQMLQMYGGPMYQSLYGTAGGLAGGPGVGGIGIPSATMQPGQLMTPGELPRQASTLEQANQIADTIGSVRNLFAKRPQQQPEEKPEEKPEEDDIIMYPGRYADGGAPVMPYRNQIRGGLDIPLESEKRELATPGDAPEKGKSPFKQISDTAMKILPMVGISDRRAKENVRDIGKTFDGQTVYSFNYKGDPRTQIGLIAQEVEKHHPNAVGSANGLKTVNYKAATNKAAARGKFAAGGMPEDNPILAKIMREINPVSSWEDELEPEVFSQFKPEEHKPAEPGLVGAPPPAERGLLGKAEPKPAGLGAYQAKATTGGLGKGPSLIGMPARKPGLTPKVSSAPLPADLKTVARLIGAAEGTARNPRSSAIGPYQIVNGTFRQYASKVAPDLAERISGMSNSELTRFRASNPEIREIESKMGERIIADNAKIMSQAGYKPDAGNVYLAHFFGPQTAIKVLRSDPSTPIEEVVGSDVMRANPHLRKHDTAGAAINWARGLMAAKARRMGAEGFAGGGLVPYADGGRTEFEQAFGRSLEAIPEEDEPMRVGPSAEPISTGLTGAAARGAMERERQYASGERDEPYFRRLGAGKTDAVLSALSGLAAMGTAPTRSLGVALAAGVGSGAQAYQAQREFERQKRETAARESQARSQATVAESAARKTVADIVNSSVSIGEKVAGLKMLMSRGGLFATYAQQALASLVPAQQAITGLAGVKAPAAPEGVAPTAGGLAGAPQGSYQSMIENAALERLPGVPATGAAETLRLAEAGIVLDPKTGQPTTSAPFVQAKLGVTGPETAQQAQIPTAISAGEKLVGKIDEEFDAYNSMRGIISQLPTSFSGGNVPTTGLLSSLANIIGRWQGWGPDIMAEKFGEQPNVNAVLQAAQAAGVPVDPQSGVKGLEVVINNIRRNAQIAYVKKMAAKKYLEETGGQYNGPAIDAYVTQALRANGLLQ